MRWLKRIILSQGAYAYAITHVELPLSAHEEFDRSSLIYEGSTGYIQDYVRAIYNCVAITFYSRVDNVFNNA